MNEPAREATGSHGWPTQPRLCDRARRWVQLLATLGIVAACEGPSIDVPVAPGEADDRDQETERDGGPEEDDGRQDRDDGDDERLVPCADAATCDARQPYCSPGGFCVECLEDSQCPNGEYCDVDDGECEDERD